MSASGKTAQIWNTVTGECEADLNHSEIVHSAVFSPDGMYIASSADMTVRIWNTITEECIAEVKEHFYSCFISVIFSPDSMHIASVCEFDKTVWIWNTTTGECEAKLKGHLDDVKSAIFSPDGIYIVTASSDKTARIWNILTGECEAVLRGHSENVNYAVFSPDGMHIVSASDDETVRIWNTITKECEAELKGHSDKVNSVIFSSDGIHIVSTDDKTARVWNSITGECEVVWKGHTSIQSLLDNRPLGLSIPDGVFIHCNFKGQISVSSQPSFLEIDNNTIFHTINLHKIFVPPPFRNPTTITYYLSKICLGYASGEILVLEVCVACILLHIYY